MVYMVLIISNVISNFYWVQWKVPILSISIVVGPSPIKKTFILFLLYFSLNKIKKNEINSTPCFLLPHLKILMPSPPKNLNTANFH